MVVWKRISSNDAWRRKNLSKKDSKVLEYMGYAAKGRRNQRYMQLVLNKPYCVFCTILLPISEFNLFFSVFLYTIHFRIPHLKIFDQFCQIHFLSLFPCLVSFKPGFLFISNLIFMHFYIIIIHKIMYNTHQCLLFTAFLAF